MSDPSVNHSQYPMAGSGSAAFVMSHSGWAGGEEDL